MADETIDDILNSTAEYASYEYVPIVNRKTRRLLNKKPVKRWK